MGRHGLTASEREELETARRFLALARQQRAAALAEDAHAHVSQLDALITELVEVEERLGPADTPASPDPPTPLRPR